MERILDLLALAAAALSELAERKPEIFLALLGSALLSAALSWMGLTHSALLWNKDFAAKARQHPLCALAALSTLIAVPVALAVGYTHPFVDRSVDRWIREVLAPPKWQESAFDQASRTIRRGGLEPSLPPREAGSLPLTTARAREAAADAYTLAAVATFSKTHRLLASLLDLSSTEAAKEIGANVQSFFYSSPGFHPAAQIEEITAESLKGTVHRRWKEATRRIQRLAILLLLSLHLAAFGIVGWAGYREIRTDRSTRNP